MRVELTRRFIRDYKQLDPPIQTKVDAAILSLAENRLYPSLKTRKVQGVPSPWRNKVWEARVDGAFRITYHIENNVLYLRRCGTHQISELLTSGEQLSDFT